MPVAGNMGFWIHANNAARFEESFREIADQVKIPGRQNPKANIFKLVENWLREGKRGKWVLVLDNIDDDELLHKLPTTGQGNQIHDQISASPQPLLEYLPQSSNGSIIFTSRSKQVAVKVVDHRHY